MIPIIVAISVLVILNHNVILINSSSDFKQHTCRHYTPKYYDIPPPVVLNNNRIRHHLNKRDLGPAGPLRIRVFYHKSVDALKKRDRDRIRKLVRYLELYNKINYIIVLIISSLHNISNS